MPSSLHESLVELLRARPSLVAKLAAAHIGGGLPGAGRATVHAADVSELNPSVYAADLVLRSPPGVAPWVCILEVQLRRPSDKQWSWPMHVAVRRAELRAPVYLVVVTLSRAIAKQCAEPIALGHPGFVLAPIVIGPADIPRVTKPSRSGGGAEVTILSALAHGREPQQGPRIIEAALTSVLHLETEKVTLYTDLIHRHLGAVAS